MSNVVDLAQRRMLIAAHKLINNPSEPRIVLRHPCGCNFFLISDAGILCGDCKEILSIYDVTNWIDEQNK